MNTAITALDIRKPKRQFIPATLEVKDWQQIQPYYDELIKRPLNSLEDVLKWLSDRSEVESFLQEDAGWRYIRMTCDTQNKELNDAYNFFITEIEPQIAPLDNALNEKLLNSEFSAKLPDIYAIHLRDIKKKVEIFREENIPLNTEVQTLTQQYGITAGAMTIEHDGKELTLQQASKLLKEQDRSLREAIYNKIQERRKQDREKLDELYTKLIALRHQIALNAGFENFRDYMFAALGRFDYTAQDCEKFHESIKSLMPLVEDFDQERLEALKLTKLRPWDGAVDISGKAPLKPFENGDELLERSIAAFGNVNPYLASCIATLRSMKHVDLSSRKGKAPGGYNYPLYESNVPFIFMNASGTLSDVVTMVHEGGHAVHSIQVKELPYVGLKSTPSEVAELASMSMELVTMSEWGHFFPDNEELKRAQKEHLEDILVILPWIATIDKFQHWVYTNPLHSSDERRTAWHKIFSEYSSRKVDWSGLEDNFDYTWQKQLHLFEVPFYYIEYGMAQLGAIALWRNYKNDPAQTLENYLAALKLGYTKTIGEIYKTAGIRFDFSPTYVQELVDFVKEELKKLE